jgi:uncharacterized membrane protein YgcG
VELIESEEEKQKTALAEPEPRYHTAELPVEKTEHGQSWPRILAGVLLAIVLIILVVLLARWIYHRSHHAVQTPPAASQSQKLNASGSSESGVQSDNSGTSSGSSSGSSSNSGSSSSSSSGGGSSSSSNPNSSKISNTGPGNVAAVFVGTTLAAAGLHYLISVRRFARNS